MREKLPAPEIEAVQVAEQSGEVLEFVSVTMGHYQDPKPLKVEELYAKFPDPRENIEQTVLKAFELAGLTSTTTQLKIAAKQFEYSDGQETENDFTKRREDVKFKELTGKADDRSWLYQSIIEKTSQRLSLSEEYIDALNAHRRASRDRRDLDNLAVFRIIRVMTGIGSPDNPENAMDEKAIPALTREIAPDVYWLMLMEEESMAVTQEPAVA